MRPVRESCSSVLLLAFLVPVAAAHASDTGPTLDSRARVATLVRGVQQRYDATKDLTADVTQEMSIASLGKTITARGKVSFQRPGKLRWQLDDADGQLIVADGTTLWLYQPADRQVLKAPFTAAFQASTPISFLLGVGRIAEDFDVTLDAGEHASDPKLIWLKLVPRQNDGTLGWLRMAVTPDTSDITSAEIHDQLGNVTAIKFANLKRGVGLDSALFQFHVPDGVDVVDTPIGF